MTELAEGSQVENKKEVSGDPKAEVRRWLLELKLADKREKSWREDALEALKRYRLEEKKRGSYNMLWSNTETLRPAIYNSMPVPDVRRRFRDEDPLGKAAAEVLERAIAVNCDLIEHDVDLQEAALHMTLPGRAVIWWRYVPSIVEDQQAEGMEPTADPESGPVMPAEMVEWEQADAELVAWDDFRQGPGYKWGDVPWVGRRHRMTREMLVKAFGEEVGKAIPLSEADNDDIRKVQDSKTKELFKVAEVWEIWDKDEKQVVFISPGYREGPCKKVADPLGLHNFFPCQRPLRMVENPDSLVPITHYSMYREQAQELDELNKRISALVKKIKANGIYDSRIAELGSMFESADNSLTPAANISQLLAAMGGRGIDSLVWYAPIKDHAEVLSQLFEQREQLKQVIYEITGIADIVRGASKASETYGAQAIKDKWASMRIQRPQKEFQRFARDGLRIMAEIIAERFSYTTLAKMTGLKYPTLQERKQAQMLLQQAQMAQGMPQQEGLMSPPPVDPEAIKQAEELVSKPAWEEIMEVLSSDVERQFKIDIETDSTVAESLDRDMAGLSEVLTAIVSFTQGISPAIESGAFPVEAAKEIIMTVARRSRMGTSVEDALDKIQAPKPAAEQDPAAMAQAEMQKAQADIQSKERVAIETTKFKEQTALRTKEMEIASGERVARYQADKDAEISAVTNSADAVRKEVQSMLKIHESQMAQVMKQLQTVPGGPEAQQALADGHMQLLQQVADALGKLETAVKAPRSLERDEFGRAKRSVFVDQQSQVLN